MSQIMIYVVTKMSVALSGDTKYNLVVNHANIYVIWNEPLTGRTNHKLKY